MDVKVSSWGNSLGVRIPDFAVKKFNLSAGEKVSVTLNDDAVIIKPAKKTLKDEYEKFYGKDLADITSDDIEKNSLIDFGEDVGGEKIEW